MVYIRGRVLFSVFFADKRKMFALFLVLFLAIPTRAGLADGGSR
jgi:hypothetical protein